MIKYLTIHSIIDTNKMKYMNVFVVIIGVGEVVCDANWS